MSDVKVVTVALVCCGVTDTSQERMLTVTFLLSKKVNVKTPLLVSIKEAIYSECQVSV